MTAKPAVALEDEDGFAILDAGSLHDVLDSAEEAAELAARRAAPFFVTAAVVSDEVAKRRDRGSHWTSMM